MASVLNRDIVEVVRERQNCSYTEYDSLDSDEVVRLPAGASLDDEINRATTQHPDEMARSEPPELDNETYDKIQKQVEFYFSEENLRKDSFLMKHIQRNKQGYVSLKLVASFRKIKSLTKDWRVVLESVKRSQLLAVNEDETKIRRVAAVQRLDYSHLARTVIVTKYDVVDMPPVDALERTFSKCGEVKSVRVLHPGKAIPLDVKAARAKHPCIGNELCILVEYATEHGAKRACTEWSAENCWRQQMVVELLDKPSTRCAQDQSKGKGDKQKQTGDKKPQDPRTITRTKPKQVPEGNHKGSGRHAQNDLNWRKSSRDESDKQSHSDSWFSDSGFSSKSPSESPKNSPAASKKFFTESHCWRAVDRQAFTVVRQPLGPDGTRGFHWTRASA